MQTTRGWVSLMAAYALVACASSPAAAPSRLVDAGHDAPAPRDAEPRDVGVDGGPLAEPVLPAQAWEISFTFDDFSGGGARTVRGAIFLDARAESGVARAVAGGNGRTGDVVFDVVRPGTLEGRDAIDIGASLTPSDCRAPVVRIASPELTFADRDGDGVFEELVGVTGSLFTLDGLGNLNGLGSLSGVSIARDTTGPTLTATPRHPLGGVDTLQLYADEPIDPRAVPYVEVGGRRFALHETVGSSAPAHWSLALRSLPPAAAYVLGFDGAVQDLAGNAALALPEITFDVREVGTLVLDGFESGLSGIDAEGGVRALTGDEIPLDGSASAFATGRTVLVFTPPRSATVADFMFRLHTDRTDMFAPWLRLRAADGHVIGLSALNGLAYEPGTVTGFPFQTDPAFSSVVFPTGSGTLTIEIDLHGTDEILCSGTTPTPADVQLAIAIDSFAYR